MDPALTCPGGNVGDGRNYYFPHILKDSLFRMPLTEKKPAYYPLPFTSELTKVCWPTHNESGARRDLRAARVQLPCGEEVLLDYYHPLDERPDSPLPPAITRWLVNGRAPAGDELLFRVVDADVGLYEVQLQRRSKRDEKAIARRNQQIANAAYDLFRYNREGRQLISE